jgi:hypothetical protein
MTRITTAIRTGVLTWAVPIGAALFLAAHGRGGPHARADR